MDLFGDDALFEEFDGNHTGDADHAQEESDGNVEVNSDDYQELLSKYLRLKEYIRYLSRPPNIKIKDPTKDGPIAHVILFNNSISRKYHEEIRDFFRDLCRRQVKSNDDKAVSDIQPTFIQYAHPEKQETCKVSSKRAEAKSKAFQAFSSVQLYDKFYIDQIGEPICTKDSKLCDPKQPQYEPSQSTPLTGENEIGAPARKKVQRICFNCGKSDHQIKDCDKQRDYRAINERRKKFMDEVAKSSGGSPQIRIDGSRYHRDDDGGDFDKERFVNFKPGVVSTSLQEALGMKEDDLPPYIYRMRTLGYPPGHLRGAEIIDSGLSFYEEGELDGADRSNDYVPIDIEKLVSFPGFNIPPLPGQVDKFEIFNVPPMDENQCKENMISYYERRNKIYNVQKTAEKAKENIRDNKKANDADVEEIDMETENDTSITENEVILSNTREGITENPENEDKGIEMDIVEGDVGSLTEDELEMKREMLLQQLERQESSISRDSDYRDIAGKDQDYRSMDEVIVITDSSDSATVPDPPIIIQDDIVSTIPIKDSPDSPTPEIAEVDEPYLDTDLRVQVSSENPSDDALESSVNLISDTDYRLPKSLPDSTHPVENESLVAQDSVIAENCQEVIDNSDGKRLPDREKFAEGISRFDRYYEETAPQGTYLRLKELLKDSPRRQEK